MVDREELAWAAGFFDGEGHASALATDGGLVRFGLNVTQYEMTTLIRFQRAVGGCGRIYTRKDPAPSGALRSAWVAQSFEEAQAVAAMLWTWLSGPKREQISRGLRRHHEARLRRPFRRLPQGSPGSQSGFRGVYRRSRRDAALPWRAGIKVDGRQVHLGVFALPEEAAAAYDAAALEHFGEFALMNMGTAGG